MKGLLDTNVNKTDKIYLNHWLFSYHFLYTYGLHLSGINFKLMQWCNIFYFRSYWSCEFKIWVVNGGDNCDV